MALFEITGPDGRTVTLEGDTPPSEQELDQIFSTVKDTPSFDLTGDQPQSDISQPVTQQQSLIEKTIGDIGESIDKRKQGIAENNARYTTNQRGSRDAEYVLQNTGEVVGGINDAIGTAVGNTVNSINKDARQYIPGVANVEDKIAEAWNNPDNLLKKLGENVLNMSMKKFHEIEKADPSLAEDLRAIGNIASFGLGGVLGKGPVKAVAEDALSATKTTARAAGNVAGDALIGVDKLVGKASEELTGVPETALRKAGTKEGRQELEKAFGTQRAIGNEITDAVNNAWDQMSEIKKIREDVKKLPAVNMVPIIKKIEESIPDANLKETKAIAEKLRAKADELREFTTTKGDAGYVPAEKVFQLRKEIDTILDDSWGQEGNGALINTLKDVRKDIKESLLNVAKGSEYEANMKSLAQKLEALDDIKDVLGKNSSTRNLNAESFVRNINNLGKGERKQILKNFETVFGGDFVKKSELARLAEQLGNEGKGSWFPRWTTGKSLLGSELLGKAAGVVAGSPKIASRVTLPATKKLAEVGKKLKTKPKTALGNLK